MKDITALKKDLLEAIKSDPNAMDKIPDIIEVAIKRVADIKEEEIKKLEQDKEDLEDKVKEYQEEKDPDSAEAQEKELGEQDEEKDKEDDIKETAMKYIGLMKKAAKLEQEVEDEEKKIKEQEEEDEDEVKEQKDEEVAPGEGHDSDVTPPDESRDVGKQPADEGEDEDHPKISRATGKLEALRTEMKKLEQKLGLPGMVDGKEKEIDAETGDDPNVKESELEEAVKIAYKKGQEATVEEITKSSTIGQALMVMEKIKEVIFPLVKEDINVEGFEGNVYNMLKEKDEDLEKEKEKNGELEKEKGEMEESMNLINKKLKNLREDIVAEKELEDKVKKVVDSIDDPDIRDKAFEAAQSVKPEDFDTFKILVETFKSGVTSEKEDKVILESKEEKSNDTDVKTDQDKINMMKKIAGIPLD